MAACRWRLWYGENPQQKSYSALPVLQMQLLADTIYSFSLFFTSGLLQANLFGVLPYTRFCFIKHDGRAKQVELGHPHQPISLLPTLIFQ